MKKKCTRCLEEKELKEFYPQKKGLYGFNSRCKLCQINLARDWAIKNPERKSAKRKECYWRNPELQRENSKRWRIKNLKHTQDYQKVYVKKHKARYAHYRWVRCLREMYNITPEDYGSMLSIQNGLCAICLNLPIEGKKLQVDHDHSTSKVRGLLCQHCNMVLGHSRESVEILGLAIQYLKKYQ